MSEVGHREREKSKRRHAIEIAALTLFTAQGFEETTIQEIAERASVSPRTVLMYFQSKADIALASVNSEVAGLIVNLKRDAKNKSVMTIYSEWFTATIDDTDPEIRKLRSQAFKRNPMLIGSMSSEIHEAMEIAHNALAKEYDVPRNHIGIMLAINQIAGLASALDQNGGNREEMIYTLKAALAYADAGLKAVKKL